MCLSESTAADGQTHFNSSSVFLRGCLIKLGLLNTQHELEVTAVTADCVAEVEVSYGDDEEEDEGDGALFLRDEVSRALRHAPRLSTLSPFGDKQRDAIRVNSPDRAKTKLQDM